MNHLKKIKIYKRIKILYISIQMNWISLLPNNIDKFGLWGNQIINGSVLTSHEIVPG